MTREEAMTLLMSLHLIHTGMTGAGIELLIQIVQAAAKAEREACARLCDNYDIRAKTSDGWIILTEAQRVSSELATKIRARGQT